MCCEKSSKALGAPSDGRPFTRPVSGERAARLPGSFDGARHVSLPEPSGTVDGIADADTRDRTEQSAFDLFHSSGNVEGRIVNSVNDRLYHCQSRFTFL